MNMAGAGSKALLVACFCCLGILANGRAGGGRNDPMLKKVSMMLEDMHTRSKQMKESGEKEFASAQQKCQEQETSGKSELEGLEVKKANLVAGIGESTTKVSRLEEDLKQHNSDILAANVELDDARTGHTARVKTFAQDLREYDVAIGAVERALVALQQQEQQQQQQQQQFFLQADAGREASFLMPRRPRFRSQREHAAQAVSMAFQAARSLHHSVAREPDGGLAKDEKLFDDFADLPTTYTFRSSSVKDILNDLLKNFRTQREALLNDEKEGGQISEKEEKALVLQIQTLQANKDAAVSQLKDARQAFVSGQKDLELCSTNMKESAAFLQKLEKTCTERAAAYEERHKLWEQEVSALGRAREILNGQLGMSLVQGQRALFLRHVRVPGEVFEDGTQQAIGFLRTEADKLDSSSLGALASHMDAVIGSQLGSGASPESGSLDKVKKMIGDLIVKLQKAAADEANHEAWCKLELEKNKVATEKAHADSSKFTSRKEQHESDIAKLELEIVQANGTLQSGPQEREKLVEQYSNDSKEMETTIEEAQESAEAVLAAISILEEYQKNATAALLTVSRSGHMQKYNSSMHQEPPALSSVIEILQVVRKDYQSLATKTQAEAAEAKQLHTEMLQEHDAKMAAATKDRDHLLSLKRTLAAELSLAKEGANTSAAAVAEAEAVLESLKPPCLDAQTYEERKTQRQEEIDALNEAYRLLEQHNTGLFVQHAIRAGHLRVILGNETQRQETLKEVEGFILHMRSEVMADMANDTKVQKDLTEWCETTMNEKKDSISTATDREKELVLTIETSTQAKAALTVELEKLNEELAHEEASLQQSAGIRQKQEDKFQANEKEMLESIQALEHAIIVLSKHYTSSADKDKVLLGEGQRIHPKSNLFSAVAAEVTLALKTAAASGLSSTASRAEDNTGLQDLLRMPELMLLPAAETKRATLAETSAKTQPGGVSGETVYGILQQLLDNFKADLQAAREKEAQDKTTTDDLAASKKLQIQALQESIASKQDQLANAMTEHAKAKEDLEYLRESRITDREQLLSTQQACAERTQAFVMRNATRTDEVRSMDTALTILRQMQTNSSSSSNSSSSASQPTRFLAHVVDHSSGRGQKLSRQTNAPSRVASVPTTTPLPRHLKAADVVEAYMRSHATVAAQQVTRLMRAAGRGGNAASIHAASTSAALARTHITIASRSNESNTAAHLQAASTFGHSRLLPVDMAVSRHATSVATAQNKTRMAAALLRMESKTALHSTPASGEELSAGLVQAMQSVTGKIDELISTLQADGQLEIKMRDTCTAEKNEATLQLERKKTEMQGTTARIERLEGIILKTNQELAPIREEIKLLNNSFLPAQAKRAEEHESFKQAVAKEESHQQQLHEAVDALKRTYNKSAMLLSMKAAVASSFANNSNKTTRPMPPPAKEYKAHAAGESIIALLTLLIEDSQRTVVAIVKAEETDQAAHVVNTADTRKALKDKSAQIIVLQQTKAEAEAELQQTKESETALTKETEQTNAYLAIIDDKCSAKLLNFNTNQKARTDEVNRLRTAKDTLLGMVDGSGASGANLASLLGLVKQVEDSTASAYHE